MQYWVWFSAHNLGLASLFAVVALVAQAANLPSIVAGALTVSAICLSGLIFRIPIEYLALGWNSASGAPWPDRLLIGCLLYARMDYLRQRYVKEDDEVRVFRFNPNRPITDRQWSPRPSLQASIKGEIGLRVLGIAMAFAAGSALALVFFGFFGDSLRPLALNCAPPPSSSSLLPPISQSGTPQLTTTPTPGTGSTAQTGTPTPGAGGTAQAGTPTPGAGGTAQAGTPTPGAGGNAQAGTPTPGAGGTAQAGTPTPGPGGTAQAGTPTPGASGTAQTGTPTQGVGGTAQAGTPTPGAGGTAQAGTPTPGAGGSAQAGSPTPSVGGTPQGGFASSASATPQGTITLTQGTLTPPPPVETPLFGNVKRIELDLPSLTPEPNSTGQAITNATPRPGTTPAATPVVQPVARNSTEGPGDGRTLRLWQILPNWIVALLFGNNP